MNQQMYKLVFSKSLNMLVPTSEVAKNHDRKTSLKRIARRAKRAAQFSLLASFSIAYNAYADGPPGLVPRNAQAWINANIANATANSITVRQTASRAIADWNRMNLSKGELLRFDQQGNRNWSILNRIYDNAPSMLNGRVQADGNVYFINQNGIIFGENAQFDVGSIYAGTLGIDESLFMEGLLSKPFKPVFEAVGEIVPGAVEVLAGAQINAASGGKVVLFAPDVKNSGIINTPDGQTILAAGKKVYLTSSSDPAGFMVEVASGGTATNLGKIVAERGNITMMGLAVNQAGIVRATTSLRANGSVKLLAGNTLAEQTNTFPNADGIKRDGKVTVAKGSVTEVLLDTQAEDEYFKKYGHAMPDELKEKIADGQSFNRSKINIEASVVNIDGQITAKGGDVSVISKSNAPADEADPTKTVFGNNIFRRIYLGENASIDVSGVDTTAPMSRNQIVAELFSDQLKDAPLLRDSSLFKQTVYIDARKGTSLFDITPFVKLTKRTLAERLTKAGTVTLDTPNDLIVREGAKIDVSGGSTTYEAGAIKETNLLFNGRQVPISTAKPNVPYDSVADVYTVTNKKWGVTRAWSLSGGTDNWGDTFTGDPRVLLKTQVVGSQAAGYMAGSNAGTIDFGNPKNVVNNGTLLANTKVSTEQLVNQQFPLGGEFKVAAADLTISQVARDLVVDFNEESELENPENFASQIDTDFLHNGFSRISLLSTNEKLKINAELDIQPNGSLQLGASEINADIVAPGGNVVLAGNSKIADNVKVSVAGNFINDKPGAQGAWTQMGALNGGNITSTINGATSFVEIGNNVSLDASAGARVNSAGKLQQGTAGDIELGVTTQGQNVAYSSYGFDRGGKLSLAYLTDVNVAGDTLLGNQGVNLSADFFNHGGLSEYKISANGNIVIGNGDVQEIYASQTNWVMNSGFDNLASGQPISQIARPVLLPDYARKGVSVSLAANKGAEDTRIDTLKLTENTTIRTDAGGSVNLEAGKRVEVLGNIIAPSGNIKVAINDSKPLQYDATQKVFIGDNARLDVSGVAVVKPSDQGTLLNYTVLDAGKIDIQAQKGAVVLKEGSLLKADGVAIENDVTTLSGYQRQALYSSAGQIALSARDAVVQDGNVSAKALGTGRNGALSVSLLGKPALGQDEPVFPADARVVEVSQAKLNQSANLSAESAIDAQQIGKAFISTEQINAAGVDNVTLRAEFARDEQLIDKVMLHEGVNLQVKNNLVLATPVIEVANKAKVEAQHLTIKNSNQSPAATGALAAYQAISAGSGELIVKARQILIDGAAALAGANKASFVAAQDVHGGGAIYANGALDVIARQIYPDTGHTFTIQAFGNNSSIHIASNGAAAKPVLSAGGTLQLKADEITQAGILTAPFGKIVLDAANNLTLASGSTTSVASSGLVVPYGTTTFAGQQYTTEVNYIGANATNTGLTDKQVSLSGKKVNLAKDAVVDLSAGGDMFAYEWIPGIGGSTDVLAQPNTYAILPSLGKEYAPNDKLYVDSSATVGVGETITIAGAPGLPAGEYTLLPARYALVPGAYMVQMEPATTTVVGKVATLVDGSTLVSGYRGDLATGVHDANWSTFRITNGNIFHTPPGQVSKSPSQYVLTSATAYFSNPDKTGGKDMSLPIDVARLSLAAQEQLKLDANVVANRANGGAGLQVDIDSANIRVVSAVGAEDGTLQLTADGINKLNAESVLLGGQRSLQDGVEKITTGANQIKVENDENHEIKVAELMLAAKEEVHVADNAKISTGAASNKIGKGTVQTDGEGAFFAVSGNRELNYSRSGTSASATTGKLTVANSAKIQSGKSLVADATLENKVDADIHLQDGGVATFGANRILLGNAPDSYAGLKIVTSTIAGLGQLKSLGLNSYGNVDTFGKVDLGNAQLDLTINAAGIAGHLANGESAESVSAQAAPVTITAKQFTLKNTQGATFEDVNDDANRNLVINAETIVLAGREDETAKTKVDGFNTIAMNAKQIRLSGKGEATLDATQVAMNTQLLKGETKADYQISTPGTLTLTSNASQPKPDAESIGAMVGLQANQLDINGNIAAKSGSIKLASNESLHLGQQAQVDAGSATVTFYNKAVSANAGSASLTSANGNVELDNGAVVDVSGKNGADAGKVAVQAISSATGQGKLNLSGQFKGAAGADAKSGKLEVDVASLDDLTALNQKLDGFHESRLFRARSGDVSVDGTGDSAIRARKVEVSADAGKISVSGEIDASANKNSQVGLYARDDVQLTGSAKISAKSTAQGEKGGEVVIATKSGNLDFATGSEIDVSPGTGGAAGEVLLRAPRNAANNDVNVTALGTTFKGTNRVKVEGFKTYQRTAVTTADQSMTAPNGFYKEAEAYMQAVRSNPNSFYSRLGLSPTGSISVIPGLEIVNNNGALTVSNDWSLHNWRFDAITGTRVTDTTQLTSGLDTNGNELLAGNLTLRAVGAVNINGTLSDGFGSSVIGTNTTLPQGIQSWSYRIVAGADSNASNLLATNPTASANVALANGKGIRTGTGDIDIAASGDLTMGNSSSVIYTAGHNAPTFDGFDAPTNTLKPVYLTDGGDISINVAGNIVGKEPNSGRQLINNWLYRVGGGTGDLDTTWWVRPDLFSQSLATLGGGNIEIHAGKDVSNFSASLPTNARFDTNGTTGDQSVLGGGFLTMDVGGNLTNGVYFVAKGEGNINVDGAIQKQNTFGTTFALQDGKFNVNAKQDVFINSVFNPTLFSHATANAQSTLTNGMSSFFNSYSENAGIKVSSLLANIDFERNPSANGVAGLVNSQQLALTLFPSQVKTIAFNGDIEFGAGGKGAVLMPSKHAQLDLLANGDLLLNNVVMSDADPTLGTVTNPNAGAGAATQYYNGLFKSGPSLLFASNTNNNLIVAQNGSILAGASGNAINSPKAATVYASEDIDSIKFSLQNNHLDDVSLIKAGHDILIADTEVAGPGYLSIQAGRNIDLAKTSAKIAATGNVNNPALPQQGASISLQAGLGSGANLAAYINRYISPNGAGPAVLANKADRLATYHQSTSEKLTAFMRKLKGDGNLTNEQAYAAFMGVNDETKLLFLNQHLMSELLASGNDFAKAKNHERGYNAIATLYPNENPGDILLFKSKVTTNSGGSIDLIAPYGLINVGVQGGGSDLGVITEKIGQIRAIAGTGFDVNQSKVITQLGSDTGESDISVWSTAGTIDAGRGSKTATSVPERIVSTDVDGNTIVEVRGVAEGSGIRAQSYDPDGPQGPLEEPRKGKVTLIAPVVDAGEAGIEAGDLVLVAPIVLNATNIQVQGSSSGVPVTATTSVAGAGVTTTPDSVNAAVAQVAQAVAQSANQSLVKPSLPSIIYVDVISIGK